MTQHLPDDSPLDARLRDRLGLAAEVLDRVAGGGQDDEPEVVD